MTGPVVLCRCGHARLRHDGELAPQCEAPSCICLGFRPGDTVAASPRIVPTQREAAARAPAPRCTACSHGKKRHEVLGFAPACVIAECDCGQYTDTETGHVSKPAALTSITGTEANKPVAPLASTPVSVETVAGPEQDPDTAPPAFTEPPADQAPAPVGVDDLLQRGRDSELKPIARLAERIDSLIEDLRDRLTDEAAATDVKTLIADLEQQLASAKGQLRQVATGRRTPPANNTDGDNGCPDCPRTFTTIQGVTMHRTRAHGYRKAG